MPMRFLAGISIVALLLAGCKGQTTSGLPTTSDKSTSDKFSFVNNGILPVSGASEDDVLGSMAQALHSHMYPLFIAVSRKGKTHYFPSNAQVLRTDNAIIVRAFARIYVFPKLGCRVVVSSLPGDALAKDKDIPLVKDSKVDAAVVRVDAQKSSRTNSTLCSDCAMLITSRKTVLNDLEKWHGEVDSWSGGVGHAMVGINPNITNCPQDQAGGSGCGSSSGGSGGGSGFGSGGGSRGGGSDPGSSLSTPNPKPTPIPPDLKQCWNAAVSSHTFWLNYCLKEFNGSGYPYLSCVAAALQSTQYRINWCTNYFTGPPA